MDETSGIKSQSPETIDFVILTASQKEKEAVLWKLAPFQPVATVDDENYQYHRVNLPVRFNNATTGYYHVIIFCLHEPGKVETIHATNFVIQKWNPRNICIVGIAKGVHNGKVNLGDILIASNILYFELQDLAKKKISLQENIHPKIHLVENANNFSNLEWIENIKIQRPEPGKTEVHIGPIASVDQAILSGKTMEKILHERQEIIGVEIEAVGVAIAAAQTDNHPGVVMIRAVSELIGSPQDPLKGAGWEKYACFAAASFCISYLQNGPIPLNTTVKDGLKSSDEGKSTHARNQKERTKEEVEGEENAATPETKPKEGEKSVSAKQAAQKDRLKRFYAILAGIGGFILQASVALLNYTIIGESFIKHNIWIIPPTATPIVATVSNNSSPSAGTLYRVRYTVRDIPRDGKVHNLYISIDGGTEVLEGPVGSQVDVQYSEKFSKSIQFRVDLDPGVSLQEELYINEKLEISKNTDRNGLIFYVPK